MPQKTPKNKPIKKAGGKVTKTAIKIKSKKLCKRKISKKILGKSSVKLTEIEKISVLLEYLGYDAQVEILKDLIRRCEKLIKLMTAQANIFPETKFNHMKVAFYYKRALKLIGYKFPQI